MTATLRARWVLPISAPPITDGAVTVRDSRIIYVGPAAGAPPGDVRDLGNAVLLPGLVNAHSHLELTIMRGWLEDLSFRNWIIRLTRARERLLDRQRLLASATLGIAEGLLAGITTFGDTGAADVVHEAMRAMGVRGIAYLEVFGPQPAQRDDAMRVLESSVARQRAADTSLVRTGVSPHAPFSVSDELFAAAGRFALAEELPIAVHVAESEAETRLVREAVGPFADALRERGMDVAPRATSTVRLLERTGVLNARPLAIHCVRVDGDDISRLAGHGCSVAHCPASNAKLGHGIAPLTEMLEANIAVGLGSDSVASNNRMDVLEEARMAILMQRARLGRHDSVTATGALELATSGGARALALQSETGTLEPGKAADLAAFGLDDVRATPSYDPGDTLVYALSGRPATFVMVAGRVLVDRGALANPVPYGETLQAASRDFGDALGSDPGRSGNPPAPGLWPLTSDL